MMRMKELLWGLLFAFFLTNLAAATPFWDLGAEGSTHQEWYFDTDANPAIPEVIQNPYLGVLDATITVEGDVHGSEPGWYPSYLGRTGVWHAELTTITLQIPNSDIPNLYKEIWVEVGFRGELINDQVTPHPGGEVFSLGLPIVTNEPDGWRILNIGWRIEPNPESETILLAFQDSGADINYIIVDTICIPEPLSIGMLSIGAIILYRRRKT